MAPLVFARFPLLLPPRHSTHISPPPLPAYYQQSDKDTPEDILKVFKMFDDDATGKITLKNLKRVARELGENMSPDELQEMIERADLDGDGEINPDEFLNIMTKKYT